MPAPAPYNEATRGPRLQKVMAEAGVASRRECEVLIEAGEVAVNGKVISELPAWVDPEQDRITVEGRRVQAATRLVYVMLYKPRGVICTNDDPEGRKRAIDLVQHPSRVRLFPVGRLDIDSAGLLLLTNDGELAHRLTHPSYGVHKVYEVTVKGAIEDDHLAKLDDGLMLTGRSRTEARRTAPSSVKVLKRDRERTRMLIKLREGRNRQIRRMLARLGYNVKKLRRVEMGPLRLKGLAVGEWRELTTREVSALKKVAVE